MKAVAVTETLLIIMIAAIAMLMYVRIPGEIDDLKKLLALSSANTIAKDIAGLLATTAIAPGNISLNYSLPEGATYDIFFKDYGVYVNASWKEPGVRVENSFAKSTVDIYMQLEDVKKLEIYKFTKDNQNFWGVKKHE